MSRTARGPNADNDLARRLRNALSLAADSQTPLHDLGLAADGRLLSHRFDDAANMTTLDGYFLVTPRASVPLTERLEIYWRIENIGRCPYQRAAGYGTYGPSA